MIYPPEVLELFADLDRCDRCGSMIGPAGHGRDQCATAAERQALWDDGWIDLTRVCPHLDADESAEGWPEHRSGPGWWRFYDGLGLSDLPVRDVPWVRATEIGSTRLAAIACAGLAALRPERSAAKVLHQVLTMSEGGRRSFAPPRGFEVPVRCHGDTHHLSVVDGRLVQLDHPDTWTRKRDKRRRVVHRHRWEESLITTQVPLLLEGVPVAADPGWRSCQALADAWDAGLPGLMRFDLTLERPGWVMKQQHASLAAARAVLTCSAHAMLAVDLPSSLGSDVAADLEVVLGPPGSTAAVETHLFLPAVRLVLPVDQVPTWSVTATT